MLPFGRTFNGVQGTVFAVTRKKATGLPVHSSLKRDMAAKGWAWGAAQWAFDGKTQAREIFFFLWKGLCRAYKLQLREQ